MHHYFESITNKSGDVLVGYFARVIDPSTQNTVTLAADNNGTPIVTVSGVENMAKSDENGNLSLYVEPGTYNLEIYAPNATSFILRVPNVAMNSGKGPKGDDGDQGASGPSDATFTSLAQLKAIDPSTYPSPRLAAPSGADGGVTNGLFNYQLGNFTGRTDVVQINGIPLTTGALVRQNAVSVFYRGGSAADALDDTISAATYSALAANDTAAINMALADGTGKMVTLPKKRGGGKWQISSQIVVPQSTTLVYDGGQTEHAFNGSNAGAAACAFRMLTGSAILNMEHDCKGATYPNSRGILLDASDGNQTIFNTKISNAGQPNILFNTVTAGSNFRSTALQMTRSTALSGAGTDNALFTVEMADGLLAPAAVPRYFTQTNTNGYASFMIGGVNDLHITGGGYLGPFSWSPFSRGVCVNGVRWANQSVCTILGANHAICGNDIAPSFVIGGGSIGGGQSKITIAANTMNNPRVVDNSGFQTTNVIQHQQIFDSSISLNADGTPVNVMVNSNSIYRNGSEYCVSLDMQMSVQGGTAIPGGLGAASSIDINIPADFQPIYEQFVGPINMTFNGSQKVVFGRLFGSTTGAGLFVRLGYFDSAGNFVNYTGASLSAGPVTRIRGTFRWVF